MTAWASPGSVAVRALAKSGDLRQSAARAAVETVFAHLAEPDRDMLEAGVAEMVRGLPQLIHRGRARSIAEGVWRAMLDRARP